MCECVCVCVFILTCASIYTYLHTYTHDVYIRKYIYECIHTHTYSQHHMEVVDVGQKLPPIVTADFTSPIMIHTSPLPTTSFGGMFC